MLGSVHLTWRMGDIQATETLPNLVVTGAKFTNAQLLGGQSSGNTITQVGFGSNGSPAALGNSSLSPDAYIKSIDSISFPSAGQVAFAISLGAFEANGSIIAEYGLITGNGILYSRLVKAVPLIKDLSMSLSAIWTITF